MERECEDCGDLIPEKRLLVLPRTTTCVGCQEARERQGKFHLHRMNTHAVMKAGEVDEINHTIVRGVQWT